jgi:hypothetical protein
MIKERAWPAKVMYMLIAAALAMSLIIMAAPALKVDAAPDEVEAEWERVSTPTTEDYVLAPGSMIIDYAVGDDGEVAYVIVDITEKSTHLLKSDDYAATWADNIDDALEEELLDDGYSDWDLWRVATDAEDSEFVAVALTVDTWTYSPVHVYISNDGGATFRDTGEVVDVAYFPDVHYVIDLAVSPEDDGEREIAIVGTNGTESLIFRCTAVGEFDTGWDDARYDGWDDDDDFETSPNPVSIIVTDVKFAPSWKVDKTILVTTITITDTTTYPDDLHTVHLQSGTWGTTEGWNAASVVAIDAVPTAVNVALPMYIGMIDARGLAGVTLPLDYSGRNSGDRYAWVWVNWDADPSDTAVEPASTIFKVKDDDADSVGPMGQIEDGEVWLTNVSYLGYISEGKAIAGVLGTGGYIDPSYPEDIVTECCEGVQVYRNDGIANMDICCEPWEEACKPPTGILAMAAFYASDDPASSKAYAVALWGFPPIDEGAWSVSFDDGDAWNQLSLIDTVIDYFADVAVSPDCNKTMLVSINEGGEYYCECDSVWLHAEDLPEAEEYSGQWLRTWCDELTEDWGLLRLAPEETDGETVYLVDYDSDTVYWNEMETLACWDQGDATVNEIVDLAVKDKETIYALDYDGTVAMSDDYALGWHEPVDSEVTHGYTIAVWGDDIIVGGEDSDVSHSDDGGDTFTELEDVAIVSDYYVTVAFDSYFDVNSTIYAGLDDGSTAGEDSGVYRWIIGESEDWKDLRAEPLESQIGVYDADDPPVDDTVEVNFTGLVLDNAEGNPMTSADNGGVLYASYYGYWGGDWFTGVARYLTPAEDVVCKECGDWDYLIEGLTIDVEGFDAWPDSLKICGCLTPDSNSKLFAIDEWDYYDMEDNEYGSVWTFEDCYAKKAPDLTSPDDGEVIAADPCACYNVPFTLKWDRLCDACSYDIQIALDEEFDDIVYDSTTDPDLEGKSYRPPEGDAPSRYVNGMLVCEFTYYWRVRAADAGTGQIIHSWWSEPRSITVAPSIAAGEIDLVAPEPGTTGVAIKNVGFSWDISAEADAFDWVLDDNADLSSPVESNTELTSTAYECTQTLEYSTTYYWQVTAYNEGAEISTSAIGTFTTAATGEFCCPQCGLCFDTQEDLEDHIADAHPAQPTTPFWVWVIIVIGAVLVIVVIVLIFRTRRV